jgi:lipopolysaccharide/colanic/teichoic acid biosynthesis glycosyltransferase
MTLTGSLAMTTARLDGIARRPQARAGLAVNPYVRVRNLPVPQLVAARPIDDSRLQLLNLAVAALGIILAAPLMLAIAIAVKLTSRGPVIYRQTRVGVDRRGRRGAEHAARRTNDVGGRPFTMYKFRTMRFDWGSSQVWAGPDDDRVTAVGRFLRLYRLDELPQLFNVLAGDMHVVGPRPEQPALFARLRAEIDGYPSRQGVPPGITGWAQINLAYDDSVDDVRKKLGYDLEYIGRRSPLEDLRIMAGTVPVMLGKRGAR